ncbi:2Fe-2S iron-sulfur cluster-binding protein [Marinobacter koreensis]|uniref:2Fe-2S iron-sulfur cluster-binding protein n=1 Tax=Marinobacter koreensis TaxID=335974 RepID=A0ABW0RJ87_9GAMM|nr:2Fe-2S iron-sulfur cluster-binding protein [Marinobacter koreensis]MCK7546682.1 2Fe-2S iron-sulfur cluster-binding protein [Marinobacter koreensis]MDX1818273.1 2Fe-2S iron-sulfur cluster-binding protein [Marinobacter sp.]
MGQITFIEHNGTEHVVEIEAGKSLMETAVENGIPGIDADCGGACACGTCHVIVDKNWIQATGEVFANEEGMLSMTPEKTDTSRLSCQVTVTDAMDGMVVHFPEFQM